MGIMQITAYHFGRLTIDEREYDKDVLLVPPRIVFPWWREHGHRLAVGDLGEVFDYDPDVLLVGTGSYGAMKVLETTRREIIERNVRLEVFTTQVACERFNALSGEARRVAAALHLTC